MLSLSETMLSHMDQWRHLPKYQLERRADIFFAMWLPQVLERFTGKEIDRRVIPEFPLKKALVDDKAMGLETLNIDHLVFSSDMKMAWMVELKTDMNSRDDQQDIARSNSSLRNWSAPEKKRLHSSLTICDGGLSLRAR